jgi:hypothetical protein
MSPLYSGLKNKSRKNEMKEVGNLRQYIFPKNQTLSQIHGVTIQRIVLFIETPVGNTNI